MRPRRHHCGSVAQRGLLYGYVGQEGHSSKQPADFGFQRYWGRLFCSGNFFMGNDAFGHNGKSAPFRRR